jgi:hypothetical protein
MGKQFNLGITDTHFFVDAAYWSNTEGYSVYSKSAAGKYLESDVSNSNRSMGHSHSTKRWPRFKGCRDRLSFLPFLSYVHISRTDRRSTRGTVASTCADISF